MGALAHVAVPLTSHAVEEIDHPWPRHRFVKQRVFSSRTVSDHHSNIREKRNFRMARQPLFAGRMLSKR